MIRSLVSASILCFLAPISGFAADVFDCSFESEDVTGRAILTARGGGWLFEDEEGGTAHFTALPGSEDGDALHLVSADFDRDAHAVAMLTISAEGDALLAIHGFFPTLAATGFSGSCHRKEP